MISKTFQGRTPRFKHETGKFFAILLVSSLLIPLSGTAQKWVWPWTKIEQVDTLEETQVVVIDTLEKATASCRESYKLGQADASAVNHTRLGLGGCAGGMMIGTCAPSILSIWTVSKAEYPDIYPPDVNVECYRWGYEHQSAKKKTSVLNAGSIVGIAIMAGIFIAISASEGGFSICFGDCGL